MRTLITGASSGLGEGMARELAARGDDLALCARRTDRLEELATALRAHGGSVVTAALDVTDHDAVFTVFRAVRDRLGGLDRVIANAGIGKGAPLGTGRFDANRATLETNVIAGLAQMEAAMEIFREQGSGHLVVVSSVAADRGLRGAQTTYAASKAALAHLAEGLRIEVEGTGIDVTTIAPGYIYTEMNEGLTRPFAVDAAVGTRSMVDSIEARVAHAYAPGWPWAVLGPLLSVMPRWAVRRIT